MYLKIYEKFNLIYLTHRADMGLHMHMRENVKYDIYMKFKSYKLGLRGKAIIKEFCWHIQLIGVKLFYFQPI